MTVDLNHLIIWCTDQARSAGFFADVLGRPAPRVSPPFLVVDLDNGVALDFMETMGPVASQHYAFLLDRASFDAALVKLHDLGLAWWADPGRRRAGVTYRFDGREGCYFNDPDGHALEIIAPE